MKKLSNELKYFFSGSIFLGASSAYSLIIPVIIIPYLIKTVGLSNYGLTIIVFSVTFFMSLIIDFGYNISGVNSLSKARSDKEKGAIIIGAIFTKTIIFLFLSIIFLLGLFFIPYMKEHSNLFIASFFIPLASIFNLNWVLQGLQKIKFLSIINMLNKTIYLIGVYIIIKSPNDYIFINLLYGLGILVTGVFSLFMIKKEATLYLIPYNPQVFFLELSTSWYYFISNISTHLSMNMFPIILSFFVKNDMIGIFSMVEKIYNLMRTVFSVYISLMLPKISQLVEVSISQAKQTIKKTYSFVIAFIVLELLVVLFFKDSIIRYFTKDYIDLSTNLLQLSFLGVIIVLFNCPSYLFLLAIDLKKEIMKVFIIAAFLGIIFCTLLSNLYGVYGALYSIIIMEFFYSTSFVFLYLKEKKK